MEYQTNKQKTQKLTDTENRLVTAGERGRGTEMRNGRRGSKGKKANKKKYAMKDLFTITVEPAKLTKLSHTPLAFQMAALLRG